MRIAVINWNRRLEGGVETYLDKVVVPLHEAGHEIAFCHEIDEPADRPAIRLPQQSPSWCTADLGIRRTLAAVREWRPDVIYTHNLASVELEREMMHVAPAVFFAHAYRGTCISGSKTCSLPAPNPCHRQFGLKCFLHFYPRRCGGLNPAKMVSLYRAQANRLALIRQYKSVLTNSEHMRTEYIRHGIPQDRVTTIRYCVLPLRPRKTSVSTAPQSLKSEWRLAFAGRMDSLKGGNLLINLLPMLRSRAGRRVHLTLAGDGPSKRDWQQIASRVRSTPDVSIEFTGWLDNDQLATLFEASDLFVMPSLWPEPFGMVGVHAGLQGLPAAGFGVGGIPTWLVEGVSGHLAPGDPPTAEGLTEAIVKCLGDQDHYLVLQKGAAAVAGTFTVENHMRDLLNVLEAAAWT
jgi:glycosyltransferase involved in cell wall biosynthesis